MIFRVKDNKLYRVKVNMNEKKFVELQNQLGSVKFIYVDRKDLPKHSLNIEPSEIFYMYDDNNKIIVNEDRTIEKWKEDVPKRLEKRILSIYPQAKQMSDVADKNYYETLLKSKGYNTDELLVLMNNKYEELGSISKTINYFIEEGKIKEEDYKAFEQLGKAMLRVKWVQECKEEMYNAINEVREPIYPKFEIGE